MNLTDVLHRMMALKGSPLAPQMGRRNFGIQWLQKLKHRARTDLLEIFFRDHQDIDLSDPDHREQLAKALQKYLALG